LSEGSVDSAAFGLVRRNHGGDPALRGCGELNLKTFKAFDTQQKAFLVSYLKGPSPDRGNVGIRI